MATSNEVLIVATIGAMVCGAMTRLTRRWKRYGWIALGLAFIGLNAWVQSKV